MSGPTLSADDLQALATGRHRDPFRVLGPHAEPGGIVVRAVHPGARAVDVVDPEQEAAAPGQAAHEAQIGVALDQGVLGGDVPRLDGRRR